MWSRQGSANCTRVGENGEEGLVEDWIMERRRGGWQRGRERRTGEETRVMGFCLHSCSIPLFFRLKTIATLCRDERARGRCLCLPYAGCDTFLWQLPANRQPKRKSHGPTSHQECISYWFVSRMTHSELAYHLFFSPFSAIYTVPSSLPPCSSWLYLVWRVWWGGRVRRGCSLTLNKPRRPHKCTEGLLPNKNTLLLISLSAKHSQRQREQEILITGTQFLFCGCD